MPTIKESIASFFGGGKPDDKPDDKSLTAEQIRDMAVKATLAELKEGGYLVDKPPTGGTNQPDNTSGEGVTWDTIDVNTEAGRKAFDDFMASDAGQKRYTLEG